MIKKFILAGGIFLTTFAAMLSITNVQQLTNAQVDLDFEQEAIGQLPGTENVSADNQASGFNYWFSQLLKIVVIIAAVLVLIHLLLGAIKWITAGGDTGKVSEAQKQITQAVIGLIVLGATVAVFQILLNFLGITFFSFTGGTTAAGGGRGRSGGSGGTGDPTCVVDARGSDGGSGGYCNGGAAMMQCFGPGDGASGWNWNHWEPCYCITGTENPSYDFSSCN